MLRGLALILLWMGVVGFGLVSLCGGAVLVAGEGIGWPFAIVGALLTWGCFAWARSLTAKSRADDEAERRHPNHGAQP